MDSYAEGQLLRRLGIDPDGDPVDIMVKVQDLPKSLIEPRAWFYSRPLPSPVEAFA
jgi:hypothetical protein